jgi:hypothetical protein
MGSRLCHASWRQQHMLYAPPNWAYDSDSIQYDTKAVVLGQCSFFQITLPAVTNLNLAPATMTAAPQNLQTVL